MIDEQNDPTGDVPDNVIDLQAEFTRRQLETARMNALEFESANPRRSLGERAVAKTVELFEPILSVKQANKSRPSGQKSDETPTGPVDPTPPKLPPSA